MEGYGDGHFMWLCFHLIIFLKQISLRNQDNGSVIVRCSQPEVGWFYWRCEEDEKFLEALGSVDVKCASSSSTKPVPNGAEPRSNETGGCKDVNGAVLNSPNSNGISSMNYSSFHCFSTATVFLPTLVPSNAKFLVTVFPLIGSLGAYYFSVLLDLGLLENGGGTK